MVLLSLRLMSPSTYCLPERVKSTRMHSRFSRCCFYQLTGTPPSQQVAIIEQLDKSDITEQTKQTYPFPPA